MGLFERRRQVRLSVIMPVYDVAQWLPECLASVESQDFRDWELIVVDDGSPDDSVAIIEAWQSRRQVKGSVRIVRQDNAGLGAARNRGLTEVAGEYVAFLDSDDVLPPGSWSLLVRSADASGSDVVIGRADRWDGTKQWTMPLMKRNHASALTGVTVAGHPLLLADVFAWNKLYRRSVWEELRFPECIRYEDQPATTRALLGARAVDVLTEPVYLWRSRPDSITTRPKDLADLSDRIATKRDSLAAVRAFGDPEVERVFLTEVLPIDMWEYFRGAVTDDPAYWELLVRGVGEIWSDIPFEETAVPVQQRLMGWLTASGRRTDLLELLNLIDTQGLPALMQDGHFHHPWVHEAGLPENLR
jgi:glycosyltransferase involved in cell wall biosynthesis